METGDRSLVTICLRSVASMTMFVRSSWGRDRLLELIIF